MKVLVETKDKEGLEVLEIGSGAGAGAGAGAYDPAQECRGVGVIDLLEIANDKKLLEIGRRAIEKTLIDWRDNRLSEFMRGNGLVIREKDGTDSSIIRFGPETALAIGLKAIAEELSKPAAKDEESV